MIAHAVAAEPLFFDDTDRKKYLGLLQLTVERYRWRVLTFVLMDNHVHMLLVAETRDLSGGLWWLHWNYARHLLRRHPPRRGHVFERRPRTLPVRDEAYLLAVLRYIAKNPVNAGVCSSPEAYAWSAHRALVGSAPSIPVISEPEVLGWFASEPGRARLLYDAFVTGADPDEDEQIRRWAEGPPPERPPLPSIMAAGPSPGAIRSAHTRWGYTVREIASAAGLSPATISRRMRDGDK